MFWGLIMEPNKRYTQVVEKPFHISQAAMDTSTGDNDSCQVMVVVDGKNFLVCTLQKTKQIQIPLDLYFKTGDAVSFMTNGKCNIHLTGYLDPEYEEEADEEDDEAEVEEEAVPELVPAKLKRKLNASDEVNTKKAKKDKKDKKAAAEESSDSEEDDGHQLQKFLEGEDINTDDDEDESFKVNASAEGDSNEEDSDEEAEDEEAEDEEVEDEDDDDEENESGADTTLDTSKEETKVDMSKLTKSQKKRLKKKLAQQAKEKPQVNGVEKNKKTEPKSSEKKKVEKKEEPETVKKEKKGLSGGVNIEDTKVGAGAVAKPGKVVMVYYEGRLKTNNKMFDNCSKGPGFKFRLGAKEVISGWDVGITGMKVGGKRRIICPPAMAYGAKGSPPVIPPNATLVFDVELKNVK